MNKTVDKASVSACVMWGYFVYTKINSKSEKKWDFFCFMP